MGAMTLLIDRRGTELKLNRSQTICLIYPDGEQHRVGLYALRRIIVHGNINLPSELLRECEMADVSVVLLPDRRKGSGVNLFPHVKSNLKLRKAQYRAYFDERTRLNIAQKMVAAKIAAQSFWLARNHVTHDLSQSEKHIFQVYNNNSLMGIEGGASKEYFAKWRGLWDKTWGFKERNRRPPRDPVNALLSLSYTLAGNQMGQLATSYGLDLSLGFLHVPFRARPSLALDLLEPVRPWVDQWLLEKVQNGWLSPKQFYSNSEVGCRLDKEGRSAFYAAWYDEAESLLLSQMRDSLALLLSTLRSFSYPVE